MREAVGVARRPTADERVARQDNTIQRRVDLQVVIQVHTAQH